MSIEKIHAVIGLGFGDEGKGATVNQYATKDSLVIRFNGGPQAGHTVYRDGLRHVAHSLSSGSLAGATTYIASTAVFSLAHAIKEIEELEQKGLHPKVIVDPRAILLLSSDLMDDRMIDKENFTTCGSGHGRAIARHEANYCLFARDLLYPNVLYEKLNLIQKKYYNDLYDAVIPPIPKNITIGYPHFNDYQNIIFEGAQGIMLDQTYGFFPYVTRSNTTTQNIWKIYNDYNLNFLLPFELELHYVTRPYQTRHGAGPVTGKPIEIKDLDTLDFTNTFNENQGTLGTYTLDLELLRYAIDVDSMFHMCYPIKTVHVRCRDHVDKILVNDNIEIKDSDLTNILKLPVKFAYGPGLNSI